MKPINLEIKHSSSELIYTQLYKYLKENILSGDIVAGEKLPSLRSIGSTLGISVTSAQMAYSQLLVEGYIISKPQSGYYAADLKAKNRLHQKGQEPTLLTSETYDYLDNSSIKASPYYLDEISFDFAKWKKCVSQILSDYPDLLLSEGDNQGELPLRKEISKYILESRGVNCSPDQIVISAGTQQLTNHLARILSRMSVELVATEDPGYAPVQQIFHDRGFALSKIPVADDGIMIEKLPTNVSSAVYVVPSNQFPTGSIMPIARRYELLNWAKENNSYIIEDDYDSELRYFGRPIPALQGLESGKDGHVVYLGSFSSTIYPSIKLSYMVLPEKMLAIFNEIKFAYDQSSSKLEQLSLALFMRKGFFRTNLRKLRKLYSQKLDSVISSIKKYGGSLVTAMNTHSGINIALKVNLTELGEKTPEELVDSAKKIKLHVSFTKELRAENSILIHLYYNQIPLEEIPKAISKLCKTWRSN